jgi:hypothetical protein
MYVNSVYNQMIQSSEKRLHLGYDYRKGGLLSRFVSPRMYMNPRISKFLDFMNEALIEMTESVKKIQFYTNYTIDKNDRRLSI